MSTFRKIAALLLCLALMLSLAACGKSGGEAVSSDDADIAEQPEFVYTAGFMPLNVDIGRDLSVYGCTDAGAYIAWSEKADTALPEGAAHEYERRVGLMDYEGNVTGLEGYRPVPATENTEGYRDFSLYSNFICLYPLADGKLLTVESRSASWSEAPEGVDRNSSEYGSYYRNTNEYFIRFLNADGSEVSTSKIILDPDAYLEARSCTVDAEGKLVAALNTGLVRIGADGNTVDKIDRGGMYIESVVTLKDGTVAVAAWGERGKQLMPVDFENKKFGEATLLPRDAGDIYSGGGDYDLYYNSGANLFGYDASTGESVKLLNWMDCDIGGDDMNGIAFAADGRIVVALRHSVFDRLSDKSNSSAEIAVLSKAPYESAQEKTVLTLAVQSTSDRNINNDILKFNRTNGKYRVSVKDYSEYNTNADANAGITKLNTEIMAGEIPDMILFDGNMPYEQYAAKGLLEDLYPYIDSDSELSREDFFPTVMKALEVDGKLCQAAAGFSIQSVLGPKSVGGDTPGWSYEQYNAALAQMPEGCTGFNAFSTQTDMLRILLSVDSEYYVNWDGGECKFESPEFIALLNFAAAFPAEVPADYDWEDPIMRAAEGRQLLVNGIIYNFDSIPYNEECFGPGNATYIGYPSNEGVGNAFNINSGIAITKACADKDGAWQLVREFLTEDGQNSIFDYDISMPTNIKLFDKHLERAMAQEYETDADGSFVLDANGERVPVGYKLNMNDGREHYIYAVTQEQADMLRDLISSTTKRLNIDKSIVDIVLRESAAFFAGQKSAEEVAKLIQSKANIYVNEQR